jgi:hypothetical protein
MTIISERLTESIVGKERNFKSVPDSIFLPDCTIQPHCKAMKNQIICLEKSSNA